MLSITTDQTYLFISLQKFYKVTQLYKWGLAKPILDKIGNDNLFSF